MGASFLNTLANSNNAGLRRPLKVTEINAETVGAPAAAGPVTITDGNANTIWEQQIAATANINLLEDFQTSRRWRDFQITVIPTNTVVWIYHV